MFTFSSFLLSLLLKMAVITSCIRKSPRKEKNPLFLSKSSKNISFAQITVCSTDTHLHHPELKPGALIQPETTEKKLLQTLYKLIQPEKIIF